MIRYKLKQLIADKEFKEQRRIPITEVSEKSGVSRTTLSKMINQFGYQTGTDVLDKLCRYFESQLEELAEYVDN